MSPSTARGYKKNRRRGTTLRTAAKWLGFVLLSPLVVTYDLVIGRERPSSAWIRGFLLFGMTLLFFTGAVILAGQASNQQVFAALSHFGAQAENAPLTEAFAAEVNMAASRYDINPMSVLYVIKIESGGKPLCISHEGARGLMQIMPGTWRMLNPGSPCLGNHGAVICSAGPDCIFAPWGNINIGTLYLSRLLNTYRGDYVSALQAYNAGARHVVYLPETKFSETRMYLRTFMRLYRDLQAKQLTARLAVARHARSWVTPLLAACGIYTILATVFFWRRHR